MGCDLTHVQITNKRSRIYLDKNESGPFYEDGVASGIDESFSFEGLNRELDAELGS